MSTLVNFRADPTPLSKNKYFIEAQSFIFKCLLCNLIYYIEGSGHEYSIIKAVIDSKG